MHDFAVGQLRQVFGLAVLELAVPPLLLWWQASR
jgi:hypothetical protein